MATAPVTAAGEEEGSRAEIAFFDLETSVPQRAGQGYALLEFGAILVCPRRLVEVACYATLVRPTDLGVVSTRCNGITRDAVAAAPSFLAVADAVYDLLHGRVWAGHNILRFDLPRIREAFNEIGRSPPEPKGMIDTLTLLTQRFGRRAGDMKMASLANYFGLGRQKHRSLDDVRMNLEVLKYCATVLFLESAKTAMNRDPRELISHIEEMKLMQMDVSSSGYFGFLEPEDVSTECIKISVTPSYHTQRTFIKHKDSPLGLCCSGLKVQFGLSTKFLDNAGQPKLSIVVDIPEDLSDVLEFCDNLAKRSLQESGSTSEWRPLIKKYGYVNRPTVRLNSHASVCSTDIYKKEPSGNTRKLAFGKVDAAELDSLFVRGNELDTFFSLEIYDYRQNAGIRLVAKRLVVHSK
ncbi:unnamed protein product [Alopecurus aequalis]